MATAAPIKITQSDDGHNYCNCFPPENLQTMSSTTSSSSTDNIRNLATRFAVQTIAQHRDRAGKAAVAAEVAAPDTSDSEDERPAASGASATPAASVATIPFEGMDPSTMVRFMKALSEGQCLNGKKFWSTYPVKWDALTKAQKDKAVVFFDSNVSNATRHALLAAARAEVVGDVEEARERQAMTNKNDKTRLMHFRADGKYAALWSMSFREYSRSELDAEEPPNYFNQLAEAFNDYENNRYSNAVTVSGALTPQGTYVARPGMELIARYTHDLDPCAENRPLRDGAWIRVQLRTLRAKISVCWANFKRSGQQDAENLFDEWCNFSTAFGDDVVTYSYAVFTHEMLDHMGKRLADNMQVDTGVLGEISPAVERARKEKRKREIETALTGGKALAAISDAIKSGIEKNEKMQEMAAKRANKMKMLEMYLTHAVDTHKERIMDRLATMLTDTEDWDIDLSALLKVNL